MSRPLLQDVLPELAEELRTLLEKDGESQLAAQISSLHIVDRCRCGDDFCATFYTAPKPKGAYGAKHETIALDIEDGYLNVDVNDGKIVCVEVLYRDEIRDKLLRQMP
jgi:major membrane immunogen (membrane-anchored lipoprotein)